MVEAGCEQCGRSLILSRTDARFCSTRCRVAWHRAYRRLPVELTSRARWIRWKRIYRNGKLDKLPLTAWDEIASSTNAKTWSTYAAATASKVGDGLGFVLNGDGLSCIDIDHCIAAGVVDPRAIDFVNAAEPFYVEISPSGDGLHAWTFHPPAGRNRYRLENGLSVEWYDTGRYMTVTGRRL